jgi:5-methylcytosine-specific restriction endonuclease McrA
MARVLVLDAAFQPHRHVTYRDAAIHIVKKKVFPLPGASIIAYYHYGEGIIPIPSIVVLKAYIAIPKKMSKKFNRALVAARDDNTCQYCGRHKSQLKKNESMTIDHIKPKCLFPNRGDANTYENVVLACSTCNNKKDNKLPYQCGMYPRKTPVRPKGVIMTFYGEPTDEQRAFVEMIEAGCK